jgi:hypothetical protein
LLNINDSLETRNGHSVNIVTVHGRGDYPILGYIDDSINITTWLADGKYSKGGEHPLDLVNKDVKVMYVNVYPETHRKTTYDSRESADFFAHNSRLACIRVEYKNGQYNR